MMMVMMVMMMVMMMAMMASRKLGNTWSRLLLTDVQGTQLSNLQMFFFRTIYNLKLAILLLQSVRNRQREDGLQNEMSARNRMSHQS